MKKTKTEVGRIVAGAYYDNQQIRIGTNNRIRAVIRAKIENLAPTQVEGKKKVKVKEKKYTDKELITKFEEVYTKGKISQDEYEYIIKCWEIGKESEKIERKYKDAMMDFIRDEPVYENFMQYIRGIGPVLAANLIKAFGTCEVIVFDKKKKMIIGRESGKKKEFLKALELYEKDKAKHADAFDRRYSRRGYDTVSKLWAHTGNDVTDGKAPKRRKGQTVTFSPKLRSLTWMIGDCLMKSNHGIYRQIYDTEKKIQKKKKFKKGELFEKYGKPYKEGDKVLKPGHANDRALRKTRKLFLSHYWACARELAGLETRALYVVEHLGHTNIITWQDALKREPTEEVNKKKGLA